MRRALPAVLLVLGLVARGRAEEAVSPWRDAARIERRLAEAIAAVEAQCGCTFRRKPTFAVSEPDALVPILRAEVGAQIAAMGENVDVDGTLRTLASMVLAKYEPRTRVIHLVPKTVAFIARALEMPRLEEEGVLRVVLAHEATHALDFERFPLEQAHAHLGSNEEMLAYGGVVEGHAQLISERVAAAWGISDDWQAYTRAITAVPPGLDPAVRMFFETSAAQVGFGYVKGHAFLRAVEAARGREGVEAALRTPPKTAREIERPELWLDPTKRGAPLDVKALFAVLREATVAGAGASDWTVEVSPLLSTALETQFALLPANEREGVTETLEDGQVLQMSRGTASYVAAFVGRFTTPAAAARFREVSERVSRRKDETLTKGSVRILSATYADGIGGDHARPGVRVQKEVASGMTRQRVRVVIGAVGRHAVEVSTVNADGLSDEALAGAVEAACRAIEAL
jgi:hypothetical protein